MQELAQGIMDLGIAGDVLGGHLQYRNRFGEAADFVQRRGREQRECRFLRTQRLRRHELTHGGGDLAARGTDAAEAEARLAEIGIETERAPERLLSLFWPL